MDQKFSDLPGMISGMIKANKSVKKLREKGYPVKNTLSIISNDNQTDTIVYTSPEFQPFSESFSDKYVFVGPSIRPADEVVEKKGRKLLYISLGTVINLNDSFYQNCIQAFADADLDVIMSVGNLTDISKLGEIPANIRIEKSVDQIAVLQQADAFISHCGMNSANEALYYKVPMILFPQTNEQKGVANRIKELGAGVFLEDQTVSGIMKTVNRVMMDLAYKEAAEQIAESFYKCGGAKAAADKIEQTILYCKPI